MKTVIKTPVKVRFGECDYYRHVNNTVYLTYMDVGLADFLRTVWPDLTQVDVLFHHVHVEMDFKNEATFEDDLIVETSIEKLGNTSITFRHVIKKAEGTTVVEGKKVCVTLSAKTGKKCEIPDAIRQLA
jgi:acyl-CoA thioester hydrolase